MLTVLVSLVAHAAAAVAVSPPPPPSSTHPRLPPLHFGSAELTCPVGGQRFTAVTTTMWSIMGQRPDGKPYSEVPFPRPLPECPDNGLVLFADFTPTETAQLAKWIATPVYQAMRKTESPFYRAYWLAVKIHRPEADAIAQLLPAIWEAKERDRADPRRTRTVRYQRVLISAAQNLSPSVSLADRIWIKARAANALREMGKFEAAEKVRRDAEAKLPTTPEIALSQYLSKLKVVIVRRDRSDEPLDMIPESQSSFICGHKELNDAFERGYCAKPRL